MTNDGDAPPAGVVWVGDTADVDSAADELVIGRDRAPMRPRTKIILGTLATAAIVVGVAGGLVTNHHNGGKPVARATPSISPSAAPLTFTPESAAAPSLIFQVPAGACNVISGSGLSCSINNLVPRPVLTALQTVLPGATLDLKAVTVTGPGPRVISRHVGARFGPRSVSVDVLPSGELLTEVSSKARRSSARRVQVVVDDGDHSFTVTYTGTRAPAKSALTRLAHDPRLLLLAP